MYVACKSLSAHDFALKSSAQMVRQESLELARTNSFLALSIHRNRQISCIGNSACLLCMFAAAFLHFPTLYIGTCVCCVCVCVCVCVSEVFCVTRLLH